MRKARITTIVLVFSMMITLVATIYSYNLSQEVERIYKETDAVKILAEKHRLEAEQVAAEANMKLIDALRALDECKANIKGK